MKQKCKKILSVVLSIVMLFSITAGLDFSAYALESSGQCGDNATWSFNSKTGTLTISGTGDMYDYSWNGSPFYDDNDVKSVEIKNGITSIGSNVFQYCRSLSSVTIPDSVTSIGYEAFYECSSLTSITIPNSVISIGEYALCGCESLTSITIPNSVTRIGEGAFYECRSLTSVTIPNSVTSIEGYTFSGCSSLTSVTIPNSVTSIGGYTFRGCSSLTSITIPNSVTSIGYRTFANCSSLTSVTIPNSVISIGNYAFYLVNNIVCNGTASGSPWGAKARNGYVDGYLVYRNSSKKELLGCSAQATNVTIPNSVTSIGWYAFSGCSSLTSITIPNSVTSIRDDAFYECSSLTSVTIPNSVTSIGEDAFSYCTSLTSITIPNSVTSIGRSAFSDCSSLKDVYYTGSEEEWNSITIKVNNDCLINATIHYSYVPPCEVHTVITDEAIEPTCTTTGLTEGKHCSVCNEVIVAQEVVDALGHTEVIDEAVEPTCTTTGLTEGSHCSVCNEIFVSQEVIEALGHSFTEYILNNDGYDATCTESGLTSSKTAKCDRCDEIDTINGVFIQPKGHSLGDAVKENIIYSTCLTSGVYDEVIYCSVCNDELSRIEKYTPKLGHDYEETVVSPTCTTQGYTKYDCKRCIATYIDNYTEALGHTEVIDEAVEPTCTTTGLTEGSHCSVCDEILKKQEVVAKKAHSYKTYTTKATTSKNGSVVTKCTVCGDVKSKSTINYAKTISISATTYTYDGNYKKPSVTVKDSKGNKISSANYTVAYSNNKYVGKASVKITFKGNYSGSKTLYFTINPKGTTISSLSGTSKGFKATWKKQATQTTGYQIQYSTSSKFSNPKTVTVTKNSTTSKSISKLTAKKKYYVRVRTYKTVNGTKYYSAWSSSKSVTTKK